jgi:ABC-2 type transport system ATP-binding protein
VLLDKGHVGLLEAGPAHLQVAKVPETLRVREHIELFASYYRDPLPLAETIQAAGLSGVENRLFGDLSGGQKQRTLFALAICGNPDLLFLDEPTVGLDPQTRETLWEQIHALRQREAMTVFMTTHYMDEAEHCDRIGVIDHARLIALDTPSELKAMVGGDVVHLRTTDDRAALAFLHRTYGLEAVAAGDGLRFDVPHGDRFVPVLLRALFIPVVSVDIAKPTLNDVFLHLTGRAIRDEGAASNDQLRAALRRRGRRGA